MNTRYSRLLAAGALVLALALAGCGTPPAGSASKPSGSSGSAAAAAKAPGPFNPNGEADGAAGKVTTTLLDTMKYQPNIIAKVKPGASVTVDMRNTGALVHNFYAPPLRVGNAVKVNGGQSGSVTFTAPSVPGTYQFWCNEPGHAEAGMIGQVVVE